MHKVDMYVVCKDSDQVYELYCQAHEVIRSLAQYNDPNFKTGHIDEERMLCFGYTPYRIKFGDLYQYVADNKVSSQYIIYQKIDAANFNPDEFIWNYVRGEVITMMTSSRDTIDIVVPIMKVAESEIQLLKETRGFYKLGNVLNSMNISHHIDRPTLERRLVVGDYAKVTMVWGSIKIGKLLKSDYDGEFMTLYQFNKNIEAISYRIQKLYNKYSIVTQDSDNICNVIANTADHINLIVPLMHGYNKIDTTDFENLLQSAGISYDINEDGLNKSISIGKCVNVRWVYGPNAMHYMETDKHAKVIVFKEFQNQMNEIVTGIKTLYEKHNSDD